MDAFVLETRPAEHFNRQIEMFAQQVRDWVAAGDTVWLVAIGCVAFDRDPARGKRHGRTHGAVRAPARSRRRRYRADRSARSDGVA